MPTRKKLKADLVKVTGTFLGQPFKAEIPQAVCGNFLQRLGYYNSKLTINKKEGCPKKCKFIEVSKQHNHPFICNP
jgi:hypothetical protein